MYGYTMAVGYPKIKMSYELIRLPGRSVTSNLNHFLGLGTLLILSTGSFKTIT